MVGVPILWRGGVVGACVVFSRDPERVFTRTDSARLELFARHAAIALANARLYQEAEAHARAEAAAAERDRLVREVHDTVAQGLASVIVHLDAAGREADPSGEIDQARQSAVTALAETRRTVLGLAPSPLEGRSLAEALQLELGWANRTGNLDVRLVEAGVPVSLPDGLAHQLFRIAQEALTNAVRHAGARSVRIGVIHEDGTVAVLVQDDGQGFSAGRGDRLDRAARDARAGPADRRHAGGRLGGRLGHPGAGQRAAGRGRAVATSRVRVLVAAPHPITRAGVVRLLAAGEPALQVAGEVDSVAAALDAYRLLAPDVVVAHLDLADPDGLAGVTGVPGPRPGRGRARRCAPGGTRSGPRRPCGPARAAGWSTTRPAPSWPGRCSPRPRAGRWCPRPRCPGLADAVPLTDREREVFGLVRRGLRDKQIAERLVISVKTVEKHVGAVAAEDRRPQPHRAGARWGKSPP